MGGRRLFAETSAPLAREAHSADETRELGSALAGLLRPGDVVLLVGELGAGKTCFAQGVAHGLEVREQVTSPTFTLIREYRGRLPLYHLDAYRLEGAADLFAIGADEYLDARRRPAGGMGRPRARFLYHGPPGDNLLFRYER